MNHTRPMPTRQQGVTLVELMITLAITLFLVTAAAYVYLNTRETQRAVERNSANQETGSFALELLGRDIANAGFYPTVAPPISPNFPKMRRVDGYPPAQGIPVRSTDWTSPSSSDNAYITGIFGCEGSVFDVATGTCGTPSSTAPDSLVINYFSSDAMNSVVGTRRDCNGADAANDASNAIRKLNDGTPATTLNAALPPQLPLFVSNRYSLGDTTTEIEKQSVTTMSLRCSGNGNTSGYQPILLGVEDLQLTYGVYNNATTRAPDRFYTALEIKNDLATLNINGVALSPWSRVVAVRVCIMTRSVGAAPKIADKSTALRKYINCNNEEKSQSASDTSLRKRFIQIFAVQNNINQSY